MNPTREPGDTHGAEHAETNTLENIERLGQTDTPSARNGNDIHVLSVVGQVEGHILLPPKNKTTKYEHVIPQLVAIEQDPEIKGLLLVLNTVGGDIEAGLAIAEMVRGLSKPTVSLVLGGGHSIGVPIAVAARCSFIAATATMTIHPVRLTGMVISVPQTYEYMEKMQDRIIRFIVDNSRVPEHVLREMMFRTGELVRDVGTVLVGAEAVQAGIIDEVGGLSQAIATLRSMIAARNHTGSQETVYLAGVRDPAVSGPLSYPHPAPAAAPPPRFQ